MRTTTLRLVTIIAERILKDRVLKDIRKLGARGFTLTDAIGEGSRGVRAHEWEGPDVRIETIVSPEVADKIVTYVAERYFAHYAVVVHMHETEVVRGEKYI